MPVFQTYQAIGEREDLLPIIVNITGTETPFTAACKRTEATATFHEWQTDALRAAAANAQIEGTDATFPTLVPTTRLGNPTQIQNAHFFVAHTMEWVSKAGRDSEYQYQAEKAMKELARDLELDALTSTSASGASATARSMTGLFSAVSTNSSTAASSRALSEDLYNEMLQTIFESSGKPNVTYCNGFNKRQISAFPGQTGLRRNIAAADRTTINASDVYQSNFGEQTIILNRHVPAANVALVEQAIFRLAVGRPTKHYPLPDLGGGPRGKVEHELTLEYGNEASSGEILNLTTS